MDLEAFKFNPKLAVEWVKKRFPYAIRPHHNPDRGEEIFQWLTSNVGPLDEKWTYLGNDILFKTKEDCILFKMTWWSGQIVDEEISWFS